MDFSISSWPRSAFVPYAYRPHRVPPSHQFQSSGYQPSGSLAIVTPSTSEQQLRAPLLSALLMSGGQMYSHANINKNGTIHVIFDSSNDVSTDDGSTTETMESIDLRLPDRHVSDHHVSDSVVPDSVTHDHVVPDCTPKNGDPSSSSSSRSSSNSLNQQHEEEQRLLQFLERSCIDTLSSMHRRCPQRAQSESCAASKSDQTVPESSSPPALDLSIRSYPLRRWPCVRLNKGSALDAPEITHDINFISTSRITNKTEETCTSSTESQDDRETLMRETPLYSSFENRLLYSSENFKLLKGTLAEQIKRHHHSKLYRTKSLRNNLTKTLNHLSKIERFHAFNQRDTKYCFDVLAKINN